MRAQGKGSVRRPKVITEAEEAARWAATFGGQDADPTPEQLAEAEAEFAADIAAIEAAFGEVPR